MTIGDKTNGRKSDIESWETEMGGEAHSVTGSRPTRLSTRGSERGGSERAGKWRRRRRPGGAVVGWERTMVGVLSRRQVLRTSLKGPASFYSHSPRLSPTVLQRRLPKKALWAGGITCHSCPPPAQQAPKIKEEHPPEPPSLHCILGPFHFPTCTRPVESATKRPGCLATVHLASNPP